jgi:acetolactate synthase small subunit
MAKQAKDDEDDVSLFPFLSILACVIGTLTLMITALAIGQMDTPAVAQAEEAEQVEQQLADKQDEVKQLRQQLRQSAKNVGELFNLESQLVLLKEQIAKHEEEAKDLSKQIDPSLVQVDYEAKILELQQEKARLDEKLARIRTELGEREENQEAVVQIRPGGSAVDFEPTFIECREDGIVIYEDGAEPQRVARGQIGGDVRYLSLLDQVAASQDRVVTFLLRADGIATYNQARGVAQARYARNGKLPVLGKGKLDLSLFKEPAKK